MIKSLMVGDTVKVVNRANSLTLKGSISILVNPNNRIVQNGGAVIIIVNSGCYKFFIGSKRFVIPHGDNGRGIVVRTRLVLTEKI